MNERRTRPNREWAKLVDLAVSAQNAQSRRAWAALLHAEGVPFRVIVRVLSEPAGQRRPDQR